jgi:LPPG:FO 2-phospho-L-lactate transferase
VKVAVLTGGVGGGRFLCGLVDAVDPANVTAIVNVGDDVEVLGLAVSPDLDSVLYALAGMADEERGWGRADETWNALASIQTFGGEAWFRLGDRDLGLHLVRTQALRAGEPLSTVTARLAAALGLETSVVPATDELLRTWVDTPSGSFDFQHWFVARAHRDPVDRVRFEGAVNARPASGVLEALHEADQILIAPSNPFVSVGPILAVERIRSTLERRRVPCVALSPLIGGQAVKGPAAAMLKRLQGGTSAAHVAQCYLGLIDALVIDETDAADGAAVHELGVRPIVTRTLMRDTGARRRLAEAALDAVALA